MKRKIQSDKDNGAEGYECNHTINILTLRYDVQVSPQGTEKKRPLLLWQQVVVLHHSLIWQQAVAKLVVVKKIHLQIIII